MNYGDVSQNDLHYSPSILAEFLNKIIETPESRHGAFETLVNTVGGFEQELADSSRR